MAEVMVHLTQEDRARLRDLITSYSGLGEALQTDEALERAVEQRLAAHGLDDLTSYWPLVQRHLRGEMNSLVQILTNKETFFLREMHHFEVLRDRVLPELVAARKLRTIPGRLSDVRSPWETPLRLWSAGCSTGEEAYSLAITLLEYRREQGPLEAEIVATDIDVAAIEVAQRGVYGERSIRLVPADLLQRYFTFDGRAFHIAPEVARLVRFQVHNLAEDTYPSALANLDVVFCRNVTIYFDQEARDRLNARLADALREGGYLFVASAETMGHNRGRLELFPVGNTFLFRKRSSAEALPELWQPVAPPLFKNASPPAHLPPPAIQPQPHNGIAGLAPPEGWLQRARQAFQQQEYTAVLYDLDHIPYDQPAVLEAYRLRAAALVQQDRLDEAELACQYLLAHDPWHVDAHFLMGLIAYHQGQAGAAIQALKTAVYLQPEHRWAHFYLAEAYRSLGLQDQARREYKNTLNTLRVAQQIRQAPDLNLSGLQDDVLRQACQLNLEKLGDRSAQRQQGDT
jgi:chemotaxis protein methyltransferase CheR